MFQAGIDRSIKWTICIEKRCNSYNSSSIKCERYKIKQSFQPEILSLSWITPSNGELFEIFLEPVDTRMNGTETKPQSLLFLVAWSWNYKWFRIIHTPYQSQKHVDYQNLRLWKYAMMRYTSLKCTFFGLESKLLKSWKSSNIP